MDGSGPSWVKPVGWLASGRKAGSRYACPRSPSWGTAQGRWWMDCTIGDGRTRKAGWKPAFRFGGRVRVRFNGGWGGRSNAAFCRSATTRSGGRVGAGGAAQCQGRAWARVWVIDRNQIGCEGRQTIGLPDTSKANLIYEIHPISFKSLARNSKGSPFNFKTGFEPAAGNAVAARGGGQSRRAVCAGRGHAFPVSPR